ncbi:MAG: 4-hydroxy-tetrahydrodipicolinate synthase [Gammaproteobacteria bacterium]
MFRGSMVALVTPMTPAGDIDFDSLDALVEWHIEKGTDAIVAVGTTGESATLDHKEHCAVVRRVVDVAKGRVPVIAGTGSNSTQEAIALSECAKGAGADACLLVTPYYNKPTQEGLYQHYRVIAEAVALPHILYNVPGRTGCDMLTDTVERLSAISNIVGIKEAGSKERAIDIVNRCGSALDVFSGNDDEAREVMLAGGRGVISVTANVAPDQMHAMAEAAIAGNKELANQLDAKLSGLHSALFLESNPIPAKWAVAELGLIGAGIRLPMTWLSESEQPKVREAMRAAGIE